MSLSRLPRAASSVRRWRAASLSVRLAPVRSLFSSRRVIACAPTAATQQRLGTSQPLPLSLVLQPRRMMSIKKVPVPPLPESVLEGNIMATPPPKKVGDVVAVDEVIAMLETDKAVVELMAPVAGTITVAPTPSHVFKPNEVLFEIDTSAAAKPAAKPAAAAAPASAPAAPKPAAPAAPAPAAKPAAAASGHAHHPRIQFRYGRANQAAAASGGSHGAPVSSAPASAAAGGAKAGSKLAIPISVFTSDSLVLDVSSPDPWSGTPERYRPAHLTPAIMQLIELGGAVDPPAPAKAKAGGKGGAAGAKKK